MDRVERNAFSRIAAEPSLAMDSVANWMDRALKADVPIMREQIEAWSAGARQAAARAREIEKDLANAGGFPRERLDETTATAVYEAALVRMTRLAVHAQQAATYAELREIDADVCFVIDVLEALGLGVVRPSENMTLKGA